MYPRRSRDRERYWGWWTARERLKVPQARMRRLVGACRDLAQAEGEHPDSMNLRWPRAREVAVGWGSGTASRTRRRLCRTVDLECVTDRTLVSSLWLWSRKTRTCACPLQMVSIFNTERDGKKGTYIRRTWSFAPGLLQMYLSRRYQSSHWRLRAATGPAMIFAWVAISPLAHELALELDCTPPAPAASSA